MGDKDTLHILVGITEDNLSELMKYHSCRNDFHVSTYTATSAKELEQKLESHRYDGVITDYFLGDKNAIQLRRKNQLEIPFIIHTWYHSELLEEKALKNNVTAMLQKKPRISYYTDLLKTVSDLKTTEELHKKERPDLKFHIDESGKVVAANPVGRKLMGTKQMFSSLTDQISEDVLEETIHEAMEIESSDMEAAVEDEAGLVNYHFMFNRVHRNGDKLIAVTGIPRETLEYYTPEQTAEVEVQEVSSETVGQEI